ncbi:site-specific DNA-methyltransferase [Asticcacaulis solisilvae]|uniref:site-specific DNA-methyltransferase n=1 Tax=Asticcacaulis solisilvae TaxID=1217274 RepID=UPI003FD7B603
MSEKLEKLIILLREVFQLDQPDLDFGIYKIMHAKSTEVTQFLEKDLLPQVKQAFGLYKTADKAELEKELAKAIEQAQGLGADPETLPKVKELRVRLANEAVDIGSLENEVYDHLYSFFRRYYADGDFLPKRVYRSGVYAIPYEGEEVKLHWTNRDQYYIKTSEYLRDYAFRLRADDDADPMRVHFKLMDAAEGEHGNVKATEGKDRVFILTDQDFIAKEAGDLVLRFAYRPAAMTDWPESERDGKKKPPSQRDLLASAVKRILAVSDPVFTSWIAELAKPHTNQNGEATTHSRLEAHLKRYTARNTFDYFVHKDLGAFMRRELDFYVKNEVIHLDDIESDTAPRVEQYLSKIKVLRRIAGKIIDFLAQLEDFQKKLWLKKKFVVETEYYITLDQIPEEFYPEISANDAQREEWVRLFAIDDIDGDLTTPAYTTPLSVDFLKYFSALQINTRNFPSSFVQALIGRFKNLDQAVCGLLFHSENSQALSLMYSRFRTSIDCVFSDPPYNTGLGDFPYKDAYQHASWLTMMSERISLMRQLCSDAGSMWTTLDDNQAGTFRSLLDEVLGSSAFKGHIAWEKVYSPRMDAAVFSSSFDHLFVASASPAWTPNRVKIEANLDQFPHVDESGRRYRSDPLRKWGKGSLRSDRPNLWFPIESPDGVEVFPIKPDGTEGRWRWERATVKRRYDELDWLDKGNGMQPYVRQYADNSDDRPVETIWKYDESGSTHEAQEELKAILPKNAFPTPKPTQLIKNVIRAAGKPKSTILDAFAGSGTTAHATIDLNRQDGGRRKFILVESSDYFDSLLVPRVRKVLFRPHWVGGKPVVNAANAGGVSGVLKVVRLESYEDALNNLVPRRTMQQDDLLSSAEAQGADRLKEQYMLRYMLDVETRGSQSLLNLTAFADPTAYKLKVKRPGSDESREVNVDLLETFNWLLGLTVFSIAAPEAFTAEFERDSEGRLIINEGLSQKALGPWWFRPVIGTIADGRWVLIIWRKLTGNPEQDNLMLDTWFTRAGYSAKKNEFALIYVNGDNNLENLRGGDDTWKVRLIEEDFHRLMFETDGL